MSFRNERKRVRGEISCAECRRWKAKCDKQVPCSTCVKRGCQMLCPNSTVPPGDSSRFVGTAEEFLRRKIVKMEQRMHLLEDALVAFQGTGPCGPYPILSLSGEFSNGKVDQAPNVNQDPTMKNEFSKYGLADILGSLYLGGGGSSTGGSIPFQSSESLLSQAKAFMMESNSLTDHTAEVDFSYFPQEIDIFYRAFPFTPSGIPAEPVQDLIESYLPPRSRATTLCETFLQSVPWILHAESQQHILSELIPGVYGEHAGGQNPKHRRFYGPHDIALLFIVFAIGSLVDSDHSLPPDNTECEHYHALSRAALCLQPVFSERSIATVKTLNLMSIYNGMCGIESKLEYSASLLHLAACVALQIGFHKDPSVWGITGREAYERRTYFWNLLNGTLWQSLVTGRPPVIPPFSIGCHIPTEEEQVVHLKDDVPRFGTWCFGFIIECLIPVVEITQGVRPCSHDTVLALDRKIRESLLPPALIGTGMSGQPMGSQMRETTLLLLHRGFFAQALSDFPSDPLKSDFGQSFLIAYQSATGVLRMTSHLFAYKPLPCARIWRLWSIAFSAAITVGTVAVQRLSMNLEPEPFGQLDLACKLFHQAARLSVRARRALPILLTLRQEAVRIRETESTVSGTTSNVAQCFGGPSTSGKYMRALPIPVIPAPLVSIGEYDEEPSTGSTAEAPAPPELQVSHDEMTSSTSSASPWAFYIPYRPTHVHNAIAR